MDTELESYIKKQTESSIACYNSVQRVLGRLDKRGHLSLLIRLLYKIRDAEDAETEHSSFLLPARPFKENLKLILADLGTQVICEPK